MDLDLHARDIAALTQPQDGSSFYLVSVGIGDPDNMTLKALKVLRAADVVLGFPSLVEKFSDLLSGAEIHEPGHGLFTTWGHRDKSDEEMKTEEERVRQIIRGAIAAGRKVAVIDYGDSMIFGPQAGYIQAFADLHPVIIPGVSSLNAANAALGRDIMSGQTARSATLLAAYCLAEDYDGSDRIDLLANSRSTLIFFTMRSEFSMLVDRLLAYLPPETPLAVVCHAGWIDTQPSGSESSQLIPSQAVTTATIGTALTRFSEETLPFEHLVYVGDFLA